MKVEQHTDGTWPQTDPDGAVIAVGVTNATAWAIADSYDDQIMVASAVVVPPR